MRVGNGKVWNNDNYIIEENINGGVKENRRVITINV